MKKILLFFCVVVSLTRLNGQIADYKSLQPYFIIEPKFEKAGNFSEGIAPAKGMGKWGYINKSGKWEISPSFDNALGVSNGIALTYQSTGFVFIDRTGRQSIPQNYIDANSFSEGLAIVDEAGVGEYRFINTKGETVFQPKFMFFRSFKEGLASFQSDGKWGFFDTKGNAIIPARYESSGDFYEGYAALKQNGKWGFVNKRGELVIEFKYQKTGHFGEGLCPVAMDDKWGYIDKNGKVAISYTFDKALAFSSGLAAVKQGDKWGYIDKEGAFVVKPILEEAYPYEDGLARIGIIQNGNLKYGYLGRLTSQKSRSNTKQSPQTVYKDPSPDLSPPNDLYKVCGDTVQGWEGIITNVHKIPKGTDKVTIYWEIKNQPYGITIFTGKGDSAKEVFKERKIEYTGEKSFPIDAAVKFLTIQIRAKKDGTKWHYYINCN